MDKIKVGELTVGKFIKHFDQEGYPHKVLKIVPIYSSTGTQDDRGNEIEIRNVGMWRIYTSQWHHDYHENHLIEAFESQEEACCSECGEFLEHGDDGYGTEYGTCQECINNYED